VVGADPRPRESDDHGLTTVLHEFIRSALRQPAVAAFVREHLFDGNEPPAGTGDALRTAIVEALTTTTSEDWDQVASYLLAYARECMEDDAALAHLRVAPVREAWAPPPGLLRAWTRRRRKPRVSVAPSDIFAWLKERGSATTREIAQHFDVSDSSVWRHADALVHQGKVEVAPGEPPSRPRVYSVPRHSDAPADSLGREVLPAREEAPKVDLPFQADRARRVHPTDNPEPRSRQMTAEETQELEAEIAVGEKYGDGLWRINEVETGNVLRDAITSEREYLWLLDTFNPGEEYADEQQARRDAAASASE
jgi:DNA-binding MarR family transcriptional regulator